MSQAALPHPTPQQREWQRLQMYAFVHFGPNTFTGEEWGSGKERAEIFNPAKLDCRQWVRVFKAAGMKGVIITAKHHDGFCLWPSKFSTHTVAAIAWRGGKGDVLRELSAACREAGLRFGVYLSPWDRNHPSYGTAAYNKVFISMLEEVLGNYGPVFEVWFDGANGEGPSGKKQEYDWPAFHAVVRRLQPKALMFSDAGPDIRWVGNESGYAGETNWNTIERARYTPGTPLYKELTEGNSEGPNWVPAECDVSIRPGWFWRKSENNKIKSVEQLLDIWYGSVGRGSNLLLNVPPNSDGLISTEDAQRLMEFRAAREGEFAKHLPAKIRKLKGSVVAEFEREASFDRVWLEEDMRSGQRVKRFEIQVDAGGSWRTIFEGTTVGQQRILRLNQQKTRRARVLITDARGKPSLSKAAFFDSDA